MSEGDNWKSKAAYYINDFGEGTTLHGIRYIINKKFHPSERLFWLAIVVLATYGATALIYNSWYRYSSNPTVISLEKDFRDWNLLFPAATVCFQERLNESAATEILTERWNVDNSSKEMNLYMNFLNSVVNISYENLDEFQDYVQDPVLAKISGEEMAEIARKVMVEMEYHATIFNSAYKHLIFHEVLTEMGICYTYSGLVANYISLIDNPRPKKHSLPTCNYLNSLCYARIEDLPTAIRYYVHAPTEIPDSSNKYFLVSRNMERDTSFRFQETVASKDLRRLDPKQRQCRFYNEPLEKSDDEIYSYNYCRMKCRKSMAFEYCGCAPYFYKKEEGIPVCNVEGLACLAKYAKNLIRMQDKNGKGKKCDCAFLCETTDFYIDKNAVRKWTYPVPCNIRFRWAIEHYSKTRLKRDIIFGLEDLLVSLGGTAALFLGSSVLSFVEVIYYLTLRLFWFLVSSNKKQKKDT
ncbi:unnamed protein product [Nezara viridula]|uniref:Sodium channel protein Nach n=1 Tax=Nezara viridula TaxID=85310 RepID=A0A9P0MW95_NEZVI|nr:unnamed protein product [Nezara viridula]